MATYPAPAKINLFLHVTGRRDDGYHLLQTAFQFIDFEDSVEIDVTPEDSIVRVGGADYVSAEDDLAIRAALALKDHTGCRLGARIRVTKRIPAGAGLGGGSSDAATVLVALNQLWKTRLDDQTLASIGLSLGADVPVFVHGRAAFAQGVGDQLTHHSWPERQGLLLVPPVHVSTPAVFTDAQLTRNTPAITIRDLDEVPLGNDLQPVACRLFPRVAEAVEILTGLEGFETPRMSGSGGGVFAFDTLGDRHSRLEGLASDLAAQLNANADASTNSNAAAANQTDPGYSPRECLEAENWTVRPIRTLNRSTLRAQVVEDD